MNFTSMDLKKKVEELKQDRERLTKIEKDAHDGIILTNAKIRQLETVIKRAGEILFEDAKEEVSQEA